MRETMSHGTEGTEKLACTVQVQDIANISRSWHQDCVFPAIGGFHRIQLARIDVVEESAASMRSSSVPFPASRLEARARYEGAISAPIEHPTFGCCRETRRYLFPPPALDKDRLHGFQDTWNHCISCPSQRKHGPDDESACHARYSRTCGPFTVYATTLDSGDTRSLGIFVASLQTTVCGGVASQHRKLGPPASQCWKNLVVHSSARAAGGH